MPRKPNLKPKRSKGGEWFIDIPPSLSTTGKRQRRYFRSEAKAQAESRRIESHVQVHGVDSNRFTASESADARVAINMLKSLNLKGDYELTLKAAVKHFSEHLIGLEEARTVNEVLKASVDYRTRQTGSSWSYGLLKRELHLALCTDRCRSPGPRKMRESKREDFLFILGRETSTVLPKRRFQTSWRSITVPAGITTIRL